MKKIIFYIAILFIGCHMISAQDKALSTFVNASNLKYAGVGVKIVDLETGKEVCSHNPNMGLTPASTMKILTTASALEIFGPKYTFKTMVSYSGEINQQGELKGNIIVSGSGDPTLGSEYLYSDRIAFLKSWQQAVQKAGIKSISGDIIIVDNLYGYEGISCRWIWQDLGNYYASGTYGISVFDNTYRLSLQSGKAGTQPEILDTEPEIEGLKFENNLKAAANGLDSAYIYGTPFSYSRHLYGTIPANRQNFTIKGDIPDPGMTLGLAFADQLHTNGIILKGKVTTSRLKNVEAGESLKKIYTHSGMPLEDIISVVNHRSNNHYAEHLFYKVGWDNESPATAYPPALSEQAVKDFWKKRNIDTKGLVMYDGCGLAVGNALPAALLTDLLVYMQKDGKYKDEFYESLPLAGKEGTVRSFLKGTSLVGKARIKSGSIANVQSYAGYIEKGEKKYAFAIIVNNFTGSRSALKSQMEKFLLNVTGNN